MRAPFRLRTGLGDSGKTWDGLLDVDLGAGVRGDEVSQAPGECGVPLVYTAPALADHAVQLGASMEHAHVRLAELTFGHGSLAAG